MLVREKGLDKRVYDENDEIDEGKQEITHISEAIAANRSRKSAQTEHTRHFV
jgi:hypothetical protein